MWFTVDVYVQKGRNTLYIVASVVIFAMMGLFYMFLYLYKR